MVANIIKHYNFILLTTGIFPLIVSVFVEYSADDFDECLHNQIEYERDDHDEQE